MLFLQTVKTFGLNIYSSFVRLLACLLLLLLLLRSSCSSFVRSFVHFVVSLLFLSFFRSLNWILFQSFDKPTI